MKSDNDWKSRLGVVYSTNADYEYTVDEPVEEPDTLPLSQQKLKIRVERVGRRGKVVTIVSGFVGHTDDLRSLALRLKTRLSTGGTVKEGEIIIQGDQKARVQDCLSEWKAKQQTEPPRP